MTTIPLFKVFMSDESVALAASTLSSGMITQAKRVEEFETMLKAYFDHPYILTLNSATSGLTLAYRLLDIGKEPHGKGEHVISTPLTCFATNVPILVHGLPIVWADTDPNTCNIDLDDVKKKITYNTKALSIVHWAGAPVDLDKVQELKEYARYKFGTELGVVEDCAHAFGAEYNGKKIGTHGNIAVFSLQAIKHLTTGDGGLIFLPNEEMYERAKLLRWYGISRERRSLPGTDFRLEPDIAEYGYKFHMNDLNASIGIGNLPCVDRLLNICRENGRYYNQELKNVSGIELFVVPKTDPSYWIYTIKILNNHKDFFIKFMNNRNIVVSQVHSRNDNNSCVSKFVSDLPQLDRLEKQIISIPVGWWVSKRDREFIVKSIIDFNNIVNNTVITCLQSGDLEEYKKLMFQMNNFEGELVHIPHCVYVMKLAGKIIATAKIVLEQKLYDPIAHIEDVVTDNEYRGHGYGQELVKYLIDNALNVHKCHKVVLNCSEDIAPFYESCGMEKVGYSFCKRK